MKIMAILVVLALVVAMSGCTGTSQQQEQLRISGAEQVEQTVEDLSQDIGGIQDAMAEIDAAFD